MANARVSLVWLALPHYIRTRLFGWLNIVRTAGCTIPSDIFKASTNSLCEACLRCCSHKMMHTRRAAESCPRAASSCDAVCSSNRLASSRAQTCAHKRLDHVHNLPLQVRAPPFQLHCLEQLVKACDGVRTAHSDETNSDERLRNSVFREEVIQIAFKIRDETLTDASTEYDEYKNSPSTYYSTF